ncbi:MAG: hypothetical protein NC240_06455 [Clostridium sp.]|nr:hypothetical protein [Clostridium sp.]
MTKRKVVLAACTLLCMIAEFVLYYICSKQTILSSKNYGYYCAAIIFLYFIIGMLCINRDGCNTIKMNILYAGTIIISILSVMYYFFIFYNVKIPGGFIELLAAFFLLVFLMNIYYVASSRYKNDAAYVLQMFTFVCCGGMICITMAQHHFVDTPETISLSKIKYICVICYVVIMELLLVFWCFRNSRMNLSHTT